MAVGLLGATGKLSLRPFTQLWLQALAKWVAGSASLHWSPMQPAQKSAVRRISRTVTTSSRATQAGKVPIGNRGPCSYHHIAHPFATCVSCRYTSQDKLLCSRPHTRTSIDNSSNDETIQSTECSLPSCMPRLRNIKRAASNTITCCSLRQHQTCFVLIIFPGVIISSASGHCSIL